MLTTTEVFDIACLTALKAAATILGADFKAGLYTNTPVISKTNTLADVTEPTYGGYVRQICVMGPITRDPARGIVSIAAGLVWQMTGPPVPTIVNGIFYLTGAGPDLVGIEPFDAPIALNDGTDAITSILEYIQSNAAPAFTTALQ